MLKRHLYKLAPIISLLAKLEMFSGKMNTALATFCFLTIGITSQWWGLNFKKHLIDENYLFHLRSTRISTTTNDNATK